MESIAHALSPFTTCPFNCPFCCAKDNTTNANIELSPEYWENAEISIAIGKYRNLMLTGDTEPTLFPDWLKRMATISERYNVVTELRTHNYKYCPTDVRFNQVWYSITNAKDLDQLPNLWQNGRKFADEVNFAFLINKDFKATEIVNARRLLPQSKFTVRYLLDTCGSDAVAQWVRDNKYIFDDNTEKFLAMHNVRIKKGYVEEYDILRQDGKIYHEWQ